MRHRVALILLLAIGLAAGIGSVLGADFCKLDFLRLASRAGWQLPTRIVQELAIDEGDRVADLGAGSGYFVPYLSRAVGATGRVFAVEVSPAALESLEEKVRDEGLANVEVIEAGRTDPRLPDGSIDLVFLCDVYHHIGDRVEYFARLQADLTSAGRVAVVEVRARGIGKLLSPSGHFTPADQLIAEMERAGYRLEESFDFLPIQNLMVFRPADPAASRPRAQS